MLYNLNLCCSGCAPVKHAAFTFEMYNAHVTAVVHSFQFGTHREREREREIPKCLLLWENWVSEGWQIYVRVQFNPYFHRIYK